MRVCYYCIGGCGMNLTKVIPGAVCCALHVEEGTGKRRKRRRRRRRRRPVPKWSNPIFPRRRNVNIEKNPTPPL